MIEHIFIAEWSVVIGMEKLIWSEYTSNEIETLIKNENPVVIVPVGATEQHGPHLPLNTDTDIGYNVSLNIARYAPLRTLVVPPIWTGFSPHHMDFCGTISVRQSTLFSLVYDILDSLIHHGISRILLLNSHGGNMALLRTVVDQIAIDQQISPVYTTYWKMISDVIDDIRLSELGGMAHAGELETSLKLLFSKDEVKQELYKDVIPQGNEFHHVDMFATNRIEIFKPFKYWSPTGQIGVPSKAKLETGQKILEALISGFQKLIETEWIKK